MILREFEKASLALEHIFLAYLRTQESLPHRLEELIRSYPPNFSTWNARAKCGCSQVVLSLERRQKSGRSSCTHKGGLPPLPLAILANSAAALRSQQLDEHPQLKGLYRLGEHEGTESLASQVTSLETDALADEAARVFSIISDKAAMTARQKRVAIPGSQNGLAASLPPSSPPNRRRSASLNGEMVGRTSPT